MVNGGNRPPGQHPRWRSTARQAHDLAGRRCVEARGAATHPDIVAAPPVWRAATAGAVGGVGPAVRGARPGPTHIVDRSRRHSNDVGGVSAGLRRFCAIWPPHLGGPLQRAVTECRHTVATRLLGQPAETPFRSGGTRGTRHRGPPSRCGTASTGRPRRRIDPPDDQHE
jgi:hypothetical protein